MESGKTKRSLGCDDGEALVYQDCGLNHRNKPLQYLIEKKVFTSLPPAITYIMVTVHIEESCDLDFVNGKYYSPSRYSLRETLPRIGNLCCNIV